MKCPKCEYELSPFDSECPKCHGEGLNNIQPKNISHTSNSPSTNLGSFKNKEKKTLYAIIGVLGALCLLLLTSFLLTHTSSNSKLINTRESQAVKQSPDINAHTAPTDNNPSDPKNTNTKEPEPSNQPDTPRERTEDSSETKSNSSLTQESPTQDPTFIAPVDFVNRIGTKIIQAKSVEELEDIKVVISKAYLDFNSQDHYLSERGHWAYAEVGPRRMVTSMSGLLDACEDKRLAMINEIGQSSRFSSRVKPDIGRAVFFAKSAQVYKLLVGVSSSGFFVTKQR